MQMQPRPTRGRRLRTLTILLAGSLAAGAGASAVGLGSASPTCPVVGATPLAACPVWQTSGPNAAPGTAGPADLSLLADGSAVFVVGAAGLSAHDGATGEPRWHAPELTGTTVSAQRNGSRVFVGAGDTVHGVDQATGAVAWTTAGVPAQHVVAGPVVPVVWSFGARTSPQPSFVVTLLDAEDGAVLFEHAVNVDDGTPHAAGLAVSWLGFGYAATGTLTSADGDSVVVTLGQDLTTDHGPWTAVYEGAPASAARAGAVALQPDGTQAFVAASVTGAGGRGLGLVGYDLATGEVLWARLQPSPGPEVEPRAMAVSQDGLRLFVAGAQHPAGAPPGNGSWSAFVAAFEGRGATPLWSDPFDDARGPSTGVAGLAVSPDGVEVYALGTSDPASGGPRTVLRSYETVTGTPLWSVDGEEAPPGTAVGLALTADGGALVSVASRQLPDGGAATLASAYALGAHHFTAPNEPLPG